MDLAGLSRKLFRKEEPKKETPKNDVLLALLLPKKIFADRSYKDERGLVSKTESSYFDSCARDVGNAIFDAYGRLFNFKTVVTATDLATHEKTAKYEFSRDSTIIRYEITGRDRWKSATDGYEWSNDVIANFAVFEPSMNIKKTGILLNRVLATHVIDYNARSQQKFGLFYTAGAKTDAAPQGLELLKIMGIKPTEAAEFVSIMMYGAYTHKKFTEEELAQLFPTPEIKTE